MSLLYFKQVYLKRLQTLGSIIVVTLTTLNLFFLFPTLVQAAPGRLLGRTGYVLTNSESVGVGGCDVTGVTLTNQKLPCIFSNGSVGSTEFGAGSLISGQTAPALTPMLSRHDIFEFNATYSTHPTTNNVPAFWEIQIFNPAIDRDGLAGNPVLATDLVPSNVLEPIYIKHQWSDQNGTVYTTNSQETTANEKLSDGGFLDRATYYNPQTGALYMRITVANQCTSKISGLDPAAYVSPTLDTYQVGYSQANPSASDFPTKLGTGCNINKDVDSNYIGQIKIQFAIKQGAPAHSSTATSFRGRSIYRSEYNPTNDDGTIANLTGLKIYTQYTPANDELKSGENNTAKASTNATANSTNNTTPKSTTSNTTSQTTNTNSNAASTSPISPNPSRQINTQIENKAQTADSSLVQKLGNLLNNSTESNSQTTEVKPQDSNNQTDINNNKTSDSTTQAATTNSNPQVQNGSSSNSSKTATLANQQNLTLNKDVPNNSSSESEIDKATLSYVLGAIGTLVLILIGVGYWAILRSKPKHHTHH